MLLFFSLSSPISHSTILRCGHVTKIRLNANRDWGIFILLNFWRRRKQWAMHVLLPLTLYARTYISYTYIWYRRKNALIINRGDPVGCIDLWQCATELLYMIALHTNHWLIAFKHLFFGSVERESERSTERRHEMWIYFECVLITIIIIKRRVPEKFEFECPKLH